MTLTSLSFFVMLCVSLILYYALRKKQKYILLLTSLYFFIAASKGKELYMISVLLFVFIVTYGGALLIQFLQKKQKRGAGIFIASFSIIILVINLIVLKYLFNMGNVFLSLFHMQKDISFLSFAAPIGLSYYSLSAIGYLLDVYWQSYDAEKNPGTIALFICYFPQIVSGPVTRLPQMREQFDSEHPADYEEFTYGIRRMIFGYLKKLIIADRLGEIVQLIYANSTEQTGIMLLFGVICYAFQLYTDFSGCMDIILGASRLYGIKLPENFDAPFFSRTYPEFWRRWHISLGNWFRDYVMYPILKTNLLQNIGNASKKVLGKKYGKKVPTYLSTIVLWIFIGIWHGGTGYYFMASGALPGLFLILSDLLESPCSRLIAFLKIKTESAVFHFFQSLRTVCIMLVCWVFVCIENVRNAFIALKNIFCNLKLSTFKYGWLSLNLPLRRYILLIMCIIVVIIADYLHYKKKPINTVVDKLPAIIRIALIYIELAIILLFGWFGKSSFIYFNF